MKPFVTNISKLNIFSILEYNYVICDNFYMFPGNILNKMIEIFNFKSNDNGIGHHLKNKFESLFEVNYIKNEYCQVHQLSSYKLHYLSKNFKTIGANISNR